MLIVFQNFEITSQRTNKKLTEQQLQSVTQLRAKIMQILQKISNQHFLDTISTVLERERFWIEWKIDKCPQDTFVAKTKEIEEHKAKLATKQNDRLIRRKHQQAVGETRFVQIFENNTQDEIEKFLQSEDPTVNKCQIPTYQQYVVDKVTEEADPEAGIEDEYKVVKNPVFVWKALRLMCRSRLHYATLESKYDIEGIIVPKKKEVEPEPEPAPVPPPAADTEQSSQPEADTESVKTDSVMDETSQEPPQPSPSPDVKQERASPERHSPKHDQHEKNHDNRNGGDRDSHTNKRRRLNNSSREDTSRDDDHRGGRHHDQRRRNHQDDDNDHPPRGGRQPRNRKR
jgi:hypothetical protein